MVMRKRRYLDLVLGIFVAFGFVLLLVFIILIGRERRLFDKSAHLEAQFPNVAGLAVGAQVLVAGVAVGNVSAINFPPFDAKGKQEGEMLTVRLRVSKSILPWIHRDSVARVDSRGLLGEKNVNISLGSPNSPPVKDGDALQTVEPLDFGQALAKAQGVLDGVTNTIASIQKVMDVFIAKKGDVALADTVISIRNLLGEIENGQGLLHQIIYNKKSGDDYKKIFANLDSTIVSIKDASASVDILLKEVQNGNGLIHSLIYDDAGKGFISNLGSASADLKAIMDSIKNGQGTVGKLIMDPSIYEDLKLFLGRVQRNEALKALIRLSLSKKDG